MSITEHNIKVTKTAQYYTKGKNLESCKFLWIMCHGYGMLAESLLHKMNWVDDDHFLISVEGMSKFYWNGVTGRPVATWMTKKNRLSEIEDFSNLLSTIYAEYSGKISSNTKIILFGFSQGGTTVWRWIHNKKIKFDAFINYAGWVPEDIVFDPEHMQIINNSTLYMLYGDKDQYLTEERKQHLQEITAQHKMHLNYQIFSGEHKIYPEVVQKAFKEIKDKLSKV